MMYQGAPPLPECVNRYTADYGPDKVPTRYSGAPVVANPPEETQFIVQGGIHA